MRQHLLVTLLLGFGIADTSAATLVTCSAGSITVSDPTLCMVMDTGSFASAHATQNQFTLSTFASASGTRPSQMIVGEASALSSFSDTLFFIGVSGAVTTEVQFDAGCSFPISGSASLTANGSSDGCNSPGNGGAKTLSIPYSTALALDGDAHTAIGADRLTSGQHTLSLTQVRLLDAFGTPLSGFTYGTLNSGPYNVSGGTYAAPEPGAGLLIGLGLVALGCLHRARPRTTPARKQL